ncbi:hypothetical protein POTOM_026389 [Populus tomentosa]|uniref:Expansin-like EG45 domain-containing protein n=1 Tax=Populus tomentosa TaxID=118781 RepID=A0A8X7ZKP9_POPTO|nr:hypothetical protein POTOM_026389 [Populus tomentosa]
MFAAAGEGIWDNGAACGRQYLVRCISAAVPRTCLPDQMVQVRIVDRAQTSRSGPSSDGTTIVLATPAFGFDEENICFWKNVQEGEKST